LRLTAGYLERGDFEAFSREVDMLDELASQTCVPNHAKWAKFAQATRATLKGSFQEAERLGQEALTAAEGGDPDAPAIFAAQLFSLRRDQGRLGELRDHIVGVAADGASATPWRAAAALLHLETGETALARDAFNTAIVGGVLTRFPRNRFWPVTMVMLAEACAALREQQPAADLYRMLDPFGQLTAVLSYAEACTGSIARTLGLLAACLERWKDAERHFSQALQVNAGLGAPLLARTQIDYADMLVRRGEGDDTAQAELLAADAGKAARSLGMAGIVAQVGRLNETLRQSQTASPA
jgi:hypothetical protein